MPVENFSDQSTERRRARQDAAFGYAATDIRAPSPGVCPRSRERGFVYAATDIRAPSPGVCPRSRERGFVCVMVCVCVSFFRLHLGEEGRVAGSQRPIVPSSPVRTNWSGPASKTRRCSICVCQNQSATRN